MAGKPERDFPAILAWPSNQSFIIRCSIFVIHHSHESPIIESTGFPGRHVCCFFLSNNTRNVGRAFMTRRNDMYVVSSCHESSPHVTCVVWSDRGSDSTLPRADDGRMRRSCRPREHRNDRIGVLPGLRARVNSCSASLVRERGAVILKHLQVHLPSTPSTRPDKQLRD